LTSNNVLGYVFGTLQCPPATIRTSDATLEILLLLARSGRIIICF